MDICMRMLFDDCKGTIAVVDYIASDTLYSSFLDNLCSAYLHSNNITLYDIHYTVACNAYLHSNNTRLLT